MFTLKILNIVRRTENNTDALYYYKINVSFYRFHIKLQRFLLLLAKLLTRGSLFTYVHRIIIYYYSFVQKTFLAISERRIRQRFRRKRLFSCKN